MKTPKVLLITCDSYEPDAVGSAFARLEQLAEAEGIRIPSGEQLVLKPNILAPDAPSKATTTNPELFRHTARLFKKRGNILCYGDSPGIGTFEKNSEVSGIRAIAVEERIEKIDFEAEETVEYPAARFCKQFILVKGLRAKGRLVNLPKLKTHGQMLFTGAIKNVFGCVPGIHKPEFHFKMQTPENFARMIVDLHTLVDPAFTIMDGVIGQDGNGPRAGNARKIGVILAGENAFAIDVIAARIVNIDPMSVPIIRCAVEAGLVDPDAIDVVGDDWKECVVRDFEKIPAMQPLNGFPDFMVKHAKHLLITRPALDKARCIGCGECVDKCHAHPRAIARHKKKIRFDYRKCIRCFCCQEVCPQGAIYVKENVWGRILAKFYRWVTG